MPPSVIEKVNSGIKQTIEGAISMLTPHAEEKQKSPETIGKGQVKGTTGLAPESAAQLPAELFVSSPPLPPVEQVPQSDRPSKKQERERKRAERKARHEAKRDARRQKNKERMAETSLFISSKVFGLFPVPRRRTTLSVKSAKRQLLPIRASKNKAQSAQPVLRRPSVNRRSSS